jgi:hypothetical protein
VARLVLGRRLPHSITPNWAGRGRASSPLPAVRTDWLRIDHDCARVRGRLLLLRVREPSPLGPVTAESPLQVIVDAVPPSTAPAGGRFCSPGGTSRRGQGDRSRCRSGVHHRSGRRRRRVGRGGGRGHDRRLGRREGRRGGRRGCVRGRCGRSGRCHDPPWVADPGRPGAGDVRPVAGRPLPETASVARSTGGGPAIALSRSRVRATRRSRHQATEEPALVRTPAVPIPPAASASEGSGSIRRPASRQRRTTQGRRVASRRPRVKQGAAPVIQVHRLGRPLSPPTPGLRVEELVRRRRLGTRRNAAARGGPRRTPGCPR